MAVTQVAAMTFVSGLLRCRVSKRIILHLELLSYLTNTFVLLFLNMYALQNKMQETNFD